MRHLRLLLPIAALLCLASRGTASESDKLQEMTDRWRSARAGVRPLSSYLRALAAADSHFVPDARQGQERLSIDMRAVYAGLRPILPPELEEQFLGLSTDSLRAEWLRRYWRLRDPTPTTAENERRDEHERRVERAQRDFARRDGNGWDARGDVLIEFGAPDSIIEEAADVKQGIGYLPAQQDWLYLDEKWVAAFERPSPRGPWVLGAPLRLSRRPDMVHDDLTKLGYGGTDMRTASGRDRASDLLGQDEERRILAQKGLEDSPQSAELIEAEVRGDLRAKELLRQRDQSMWAFEKEYAAGRDRFWMPGEAPPRLWYVFDVDIFKGPPGRMRVEVHYQFNLQDLTFKWQDSLYVARYTVEGVLLDANVHEAGRDRYSENLEATQFQSTLAGRLFAGALVFDVSEGSYRLAVRLADGFGKGEGTYLADFDVPRLDGLQLALSDIEMATKIIYADPSWHPRLIKQDRLVMPNPIGVYRQSGGLLGYFEIYGLQLDAQATSHYKVTYSLVPRSMRRAEGWFPESGLQQKPFVTASFTGDGGTSEMVEELRIDITSLDEDVYDLELAVEDLVTGQRATQRSAFTVLR